MLVTNTTETNFIVRDVIFFISLNNTITTNTLTSLSNCTRVSTIDSTGVSVSSIRSNGSNSSHRDSQYIYTTVSLFSFPLPWHSVINEQQAIKQLG